MKKAPFKLKSGNKPSMAKLAGVDPDAPGTPGKPGYEPSVKRSDFDEGSEQQKMFDRNQAKKKKTNKINFKANNDYSQKAIDYRRTSDLELYDDDRD